MSRPERGLYATLVFSLLLAIALGTLAFSPAPRLSPVADPRAWRPEGARSRSSAPPPLLDQPYVPGPASSSAVPARPLR